MRNAAKAGKESVGVAHQWCGRLGKFANCQVGVFLAGVAPGGTAFLDAQLFLTTKRCADKAHRRKNRVPAKVKHDVPELTLDMAIRILRSSFARPTLSEDEAVKIIDYHLERNRAAHDSHRKSWLAKHKGLAKKLLL